jgi:hypothetical protein
MWYYCTRGSLICTGPPIGESWWSGLWIAVFVVQGFSWTQSVMQMERIFRLQFRVPSLERILKYDTFLKMGIDFCIWGTSDFVSSAYSVCTPENILGEECSEQSYVFGHMNWVNEFYTKIWFTVHLKDQDEMTCFSFHFFKMQMQIH